MKRLSFLKDLDIFALLSVLVPLAVYLRTLAPSVTFFDSGEFLTATFSLGASHSPGYPLFINYAKPFTYFPWGNVAFKVNVATAVSAAAACYGVYLLVCRLLRDQEVGSAEFTDFVRRSAALISALTFAFSDRLWLQSNHDKPYPLVSFMVALVIYLLLLWRDSYREGIEKPGLVYCGAFLTGLATGAHQLIVLMLPGFAWLILSTDWKIVKRVKEMLLALAFSIAGFAVYLHMPVRAVRNPLLNWGDSSSLSQFLWNFLRKGYPMEPPERDLALLWDQVKAFDLQSQFSLVGVLLLIAGVVLSVPRLRDLVIAYLLSILTFLLYIVGYQNTQREMIFLTEEFFTPLYLFSAPFVGIGIFRAIRFFAPRLPAGKIASGWGRGTIAGVLLLLPLWVCGQNFEENDQRQNYIAYDYATNSLRSLPQGAAYYTWGDSGAFPLWYLQGVERMREDLDLLHTPHLVFDWYLNGFGSLFANSSLYNLPPSMQSPDSALMVAISEMMDRRPVYIDFSTRYSIQFPLYSLHQRGLVYRVDKPGVPASPPDTSVWTLYNARGLYGNEMPFRDLDTEKAILIYANSHMEQGETLLRMGRIEQGMAEMKMAEMLAPDLRAQIVQILAALGISG